jgi:enamine deaminase RidA (YjgF/YER057c/UK114 family)
LDEIIGVGVTAAQEQGANTESALADLGCGPENLVHLNTYLAASASLTDFLRCRDASSRWWDLTEDCPGSTLLIVHSHVSLEYLVEIDAPVAVDRG